MFLCKMGTLPLFLFSCLCLPTIPDLVWGGKILQITLIWKPFVFEPECCACAVALRPNQWS